MTTPKYRPEDYPNLWRVACELSKCKEPYKVLDLLLALAGPVLEREKEKETPS